MDWTFLPRGLLIGFSIAAPVGPIGVLCIRRTLADGRAAGFASGLGAATADAAYGAIAGFGLTAVSGVLIGGQAWFRLVGGLFLVYLGIRTLATRPAEHPAAGEREARRSADGTRAGAVPEREARRSADVGRAGAGGTREARRPANGSAVRAAAEPGASRSAATGAAGVRAIGPRAAGGEGFPSGRELAGAYATTLALTLTNPMTILSFAAIFAGLGIAAAGDYGSAALLVAGVFGGSALWWFVLSGIAAAFRGRIGAGVLRRVNAAAGAVILAFGVLALLSLR